jgi:hypothetical protein
VAVLLAGTAAILMSPLIGIGATWVADRYMDARERRGFVPYGHRGRD